MEESTNHFKYEPLNPLVNEIRLLNLEPHSTTAPNAQVHCSLFNVSLNNPNRPSYEALSYVWGDASVTEPIMLHGKPFKVTRFLWTALRHLRLENRPRIIWVDAICINQEDVAEREKHVARMSEVYKQALRGLLWMDIPSAAIRHFLPFLEREYPADEKAAVNFALSLMNNADIVTLKEYNMLCADPVWGRSWIVQELILSPEVEVVVQDVSFNVRHLQYISMATGNLLFSGIHLLPEEERNKFTADSDMPTNSFAYRTADPPVTSLIRAWQWFSSCRSTDPLDRIYALLSIVSDDLGISPDYGISPKELYSKVARASICRNKNLDVLCLGYFENSPMSVFTDERPSTDENLKESLGVAGDGALPSWLPIFNVVGSPSSSLVVIGLAAEYGAGKWSLSATTFDKVNSFTDPDILTLSGIRIDTVGPIETSLYEACPDMENILLRNFVNSMPTKPYPGTYFTGEDSFDAYWRTSIFDRKCTVGRLDHDLKISYRQIAASLIATYSKPQGSNIKDHSFLKELEDGYPLFGTHDVIRGMALFKSSLGRLVNNRFNVTKSGYMAMVPRGAEEGDFICIILGSQVAHVLRPVPIAKIPNTFIIIGLAYIHGFMDGEALDMCKNGELREETIHLA